MIILIIGTPGSGKSECAESLITELAGEHPKIYIATMISFGKEGEERIRKHRALREGKGFETIECPVNILSLRDKLMGIKDSNCLLECMSNLVGNEMHNPDNGKLSEEKLVDYIVDSVKTLCAVNENTVIVSNEFEMLESFDDETRKYVRISHMVNKKLRNAADKVIVEGLRNDANRVIDGKE